MLDGVCRRVTWLVYAYCLMGSHCHLLVETPEGNLSKGMRQMNGVYTQRFNRAHGHAGHVFQGRYKAILAQKDAYLLELARYIVLNPVRAKMVRQAGRWPWSSYRATVGGEVGPDWLATASVLSAFGDTKAEAIERCIRFVNDGKGLWTYSVATSRYIACSPL